MVRKLKVMYEIAEEERKTLLQHLLPLPNQTLQRQPENKWSIAQILSHLVALERLSLQYMRKKALGMDKIDDTGGWEGFKMLLLTISQRMPLKYKAPPLLREHAPPNASMEQIIRDWDNVRNELKAFISSLTENQLQKKIYKHPVAGRLNVMQAIRFFREHVKHHLPQINKLIRNAK